MKLIRISALVLTGAVAVALTACEPKEDSADASDGKKTESSDQGGDGKDEDKDEAGSGSSASKDELPGDITTVTLSKTGGIAGGEETLEIDAKGNWSYVKAKMATKKGDLSTKELKKLTDLAGTKAITDKDKPKSDKQCNDMQTYQLKVDLTEGKPVEMTTDECGVAPNEEFNDLVELLSDATPI